MVVEIQSFREAIASYDRNKDREHLEAGEREREQILTRFPLESWPDLPLDRFALGLPDSSENYSYWLEFGAAHLGSMRGGAANKHLVYKHKDKPGWYFKPQYANEQEAWEAVRAGFVEMFKMAEAGEWDAIDEIEALDSGRALRVKTLHVYFPQEILPISSIDHMREFLQRLGAYEQEMKDWSVVRLNRALLRRLRQFPELNNWKTTEMGRLLYFWADPRRAQHVIKIAPGPQAKHWPDCLAGGFICVGWDEVGDLREFESKASFRERFQDEYVESYKNHQPTITKKANELWTLMELEPGTLIVANKGLSEVLAVGEVVEPGYEWRPEREEYRHTVRVKWDMSYAKEMDLPRRWGTVTVASVGIELSQKILAQGSAPKPPLPVDPLFSRMAESLERKGQLILYGPPGTGKTYYARRFSVWWLLNQQGADNALDAIANPERLAQVERELTTVQVSSRVWWIVANPSEWAWDELFSKGAVEYRYGRLQRNYPLVQPGDLVVGYQSSPDKRVVALARVTKGISEDQTGEPHIELEPVKRVPYGLTYAELSTDPKFKDSEPMRFRCQGTLFALRDDEADYLMALLSERDDEIEQYLVRGSGISSLTWVTFHPSYSYEDFVEGFRPVDAGDGGLKLKLEDGLFKQICREAQANPKKTFLLIVDEINRANLAKVFGELITLLEKDKRGLVVTLPQSKESFTIPANVHLLGTMNTADRSIRLMDTALRRRFAFIEMMPDSSLLRGAAIGSLALDDFLDILNKRISETEGRERQIGHAVLMDGDQPISQPEEFARRFRQEILPLLQEYCYDDYSELALYLGDQIVNSQEQALDSELLADDELLVDTLAAIVKAQGTVL